MPEITGIRMISEIPNGDYVTTIADGSRFMVEKRTTYNGQLWGYVPSYEGYSGWVLLDDNTELISQETGRKQILIDPEYGMGAGKAELLTTDGAGATPTLNAKNASLWIDTAGNLHIKGEVNATALYIEGDNSEDYLGKHANRVRLNASRLSWKSEYSSMSEDGKLECTGATIKGNFECISPIQYSMVLSDDSGNSVTSRSYVKMQFSNGRLNFRNDDTLLLARMVFTDKLTIASNTSTVISAKDTLKLNSTGALSITGKNIVSLTATGNLYMNSSNNVSITATKAIEAKASTDMLFNGKTVSFGITNKAFQLAMDNSGVLTTVANQIHLQTNNGKHGLRIYNNGKLQVGLNNEWGDGQTETFTVVSGIRANNDGTITWKYDILEFLNGILVSYTKGSY